MKTVTKRELNQQTAQVLAEVVVGAPVVVTERGVPRWRIEVIEAAADPVARLRAEGRIIPAKQNPAPWPKRRRSTRRTPADVDALLNDMRGER